MISEDAKSGFDFIFQRAIKANIVASADDVCEIELVSDSKEICEVEFAVFTTTSTAFRLLTLFHFNSNDKTENRFSHRSEHSYDDAGEGSTFRDNFLEFGNVCCGAVSRELHNIYHFLGMSTPYVLLKRCSTFISDLNPGYVKHYKVTVNDSFVIHATLCVFDYGILDFKVDRTEVEESTGELELF